MFHDSGVRSQNRIVLNIENCVLREKSYHVGQLPGLAVKIQVSSLKNSLQ
jgi:hypothetical protein